MPRKPLWAGAQVAATSLFVTMVTLAGMCVIGVSVQNHLTSRWGIPPQQSWVFTIGRGDPGMASVNQEIAAVLAASANTVVCVAEYGVPRGLPVLAVYDNRPDPKPLVDVDGRWFTAREMASGSPSLIIRQGSYLTRDPDLGGDVAILPSGAVIGTFPQARAGQYEVVTTMMSYFPTFLPRAIYLQADAEALGGVLDILNRHDHVMVSEPETLGNYLMSYRYTWPCALAVLVGLLVLGMACTDYVRNRRGARAEEAIVFAPAPEGN